MYFPKTFRRTMFSTWGNLLATFYFGKLVGFLHTHLFSSQWLHFLMIQWYLLGDGNGRRYECSENYSYWENIVLFIVFLCVCERPTSIWDRHVSWVYAALLYFSGIENFLTFLFKSYNISKLLRTTWTIMPCSRITAITLSSVISSIAGQNFKT